MRTIWKKKDGYILAWVLCLFTVVFMLGTVTIIYAQTTSNSTAVQHNSKQAYYTAKSAASVVVSYIMKNGSDSAVIDNLVAHTGTGTIDTMGSYSVTVSKLSDDRIKVKATAEFNGQTANVGAVVYRLPAPVGILPTDNALYINGSLGQSNSAYFNVDGDVFVKDSLNMTSSCTVKGYMIVKKDATLSGAAQSVKSFFCGGNLTLTGSGTIGGDTYAMGDIVMNGSGKIDGNLYANTTSSLDMSQGGSKITKSAYIGKNAKFGGGGNRIDGNLTYNGTLTVPSQWQPIGTFVKGTVTKSAAIPEINAGQYESATLPIITAPSLTSNVIITNNVISSSGKLTAAQINSITKYWQNALTLDATNNDINLLIDNETINLQNGISVVVKSTSKHNVCIYLKRNAIINISANCYLGMDPRGSNPRLYIIGDGTQSVNLTNNSAVNACIYIPNGSFSATGSPLSALVNFKLTGSCIVKSANIDNGVWCFHSPPIMDETTPLKVLSSSGVSSSGAWSLESWGVN